MDDCFVLTVAVLYIETIIKNKHKIHVASKKQMSNVFKQNRELTATLTFNCSLNEKTVKQ